MKKNTDLKRYAETYSNIYRHYLEQIQALGITLAKKSDPSFPAARQSALRQKGAIFRNEGKSVYLNWLSSACRACRTGDKSLTLLLSLQCHRRCYYCFNPNQEGYNFYASAQSNCTDRLQNSANSGRELTHIALTGGEPLLHKEEMLAFFSLARSLYPQAHLRLYTSGDLLDTEILRSLQHINLNEIRFGVKLEDGPAARKKALSQIALAKEAIADIMVEMPVIPGTKKEMAQLLLELDNLGISGINLLEFCYPFHRTEEFVKKGFQIKNPPYQVLYNYWYAGGLPIDNSENEAYELLAFAFEQGLRIGLHYCSLENKHTGQIFQQNFPHQDWEHTYFSKKDFFLKTAKVFGEDIPRVSKVLTDNGIPSTLDRQHGFLAFSVKDIDLLKDMDIEIGISSHVVEERNGDKYLRELKIDVIHLSQNEAWRSML